MAKLADQKGRTRDAHKARELILDAAETVFAQHGFDGARIDAIASASSYNTSLLFQYFGDKIGLYSAVLRRFDQQLNALSAHALAPWLTDKSGGLDRQGLITFLETLVLIVFAYLVEHPRFLRILTWEMAEGWQTYRQVASQFITDDSEKLEILFEQARHEGWLRSDIAAVIQLSLIFQACQSYLAFLPLYQMQLPTQDLSSPTALAQARDRLVTWVVGAMLIDSPETIESLSNEGDKA